MVIYSQAQPGDPEETFRHPTDLNFIVRGIIGPKATIPLMAGAGIPISVAAEMADKRTDYFVSGVFHYQDWFSDKSSYMTKFCFAAIPFKDNGSVRINWEPCIYWNCADDECDKDKAVYDAQLKTLNPQKPK